MKESLKFLNRISKIKGFEPENYYSIDLYPNYITMQTRFNAKLSLKIKKYIPDFILGNNGYLEFTRGRLKIILTD